MNKSFAIPNRILIPLLGMMLLLMCSVAAYKARLLIQIQPQEFRSGPALMGTDWVHWVDSSDQVVAKAVLPPAQGMVNKTGTYIQPGDRLEAIDYLPVGKAKTVERIVLAAKPGDVKLYRLNDPQGQQVRMLFVPTFLRPAFLPIPEGIRFSVLFSLYIAATLGIGLLLVILYPFFRSNVKANLLTASRLLVVGLFFYMQSLRMSVLLLRSDTYGSRFDETSLLISLALLLVGVFLLIPTRSLLPRMLLGLPLLFLFCLWIWALNTNWDFAFWEPTASWATGGSAAACLFAYVLAQGPGKSRLSLWGLLSGGALFVLGWHVYELSGLQVVDYPAIVLSLVLVGLLAAVGWSVRQAILLGKVGETVARAFLYLLGLLVLTLAYVFLYRLTTDWGLEGIWRGLFPLGIFALLGPLLFYAYRSQESRLPRSFLTARRHKIELLEEILTRIPRFTHSDELLDYVEQQTSRLLEVDACHIWIQSQSEFPFPEFIPPEQIQRFWNSFDDLRPWWSATRELNRSTLPPDLEAVFNRESVTLVLPLRMASVPAGVLLVGKRPRGFLNLEAAEHSLRVVQQLQLALEILQLLEQEKVLVERTMEANLIALRSQINPHFLFNTFNSISDLIHTSPGGAEAALEKLAYIIRYTLKFSKENYVELGNEMQLVRTYLELEQIRFGDRLAVEIEYEAQFDRLPMPAFVLQTIVENCVKHGIAKVVYAGIIKLRFVKEEAQLVCWIYDNGPGIDLQRIDKGTGLQNIIERMQVLYSRSDLLEFVNTGDGTAVTLRIPLH